ncbi:MAG: hypothetical protein LC802_18775 [Acidobacteria bacterium]|nr:hypothetical protein [Acidobacteriota bacterium]
MGLAEVQQLLARLYTDGELRERFFVDPLKVGRDLGLTAEEARHMARLPSSQLNMFADSLLNKRLLGVGKLLPLIRRVLSDRFTTHFRRFAATRDYDGHTQYLGDALEFARYLEEHLREERVGSGWILDLLRFERARLKASDPSRRWVARYFRHDISRLVRSVARKEKTPIVARRSTVAVWWRPVRRGTVRYAVFAAPSIFKKGQS